MSRLSVRSLRSDSAPPHSSGRQPLPLRLSHHGFSLSLPGMLISARQGSREVITSHSLERYLCPAGPAAASARSRSHLLQFSWLVGLPSPFPSPSPSPSRSTHTVPCRSYDSLSSLSGRWRGGREELLGAAGCLVCSAAVEELAPGHLVLLTEPYLGPEVVNGAPRCESVPAPLPSADLT